MDSSHAWKGDLTGIIDWALVKGGIIGISQQDEWCHLEREYRKKKKVYLLACLSVWVGCVWGNRS